MRIFLKCLKEEILKLLEELLQNTGKILKIPSSSVRSRQYKERKNESNGNY